MRQREDPGLTLVLLNELGKVVPVGLLRFAL